MKLATSTWVKIALIGLLCLGVCGWLGGCGRGVWFASSPLWPGGVLGWAGINAVDGALSGLAQPGNYETTTEGTRFEADASEVSAIEVNWLAGSGQVRVAPDSETGGKVIVEKVNMVSRHTKPRQQGEQGGILQKEAPIYACKVQRVCPKCNKPTRPAHKVEGGKKTRVCKHCGAEHTV